MCLSIHMHLGVTHVSIAKVQHKHVPVVGLSASTSSVTPALRPLQRQGQARVGLQILQVLWCTQLHVAVALKHHGDPNLEKTHKRGMDP